MPRPRKEGLDYFPHDTDAVGDEKVEALRSLYGNDGYAFFFILLERIYRMPKAELDVSDAETRQILARKTGLTPERFEDILKTAINRKCFDKKKYDKYGVLTSDAIKKNLKRVVQKRLDMQEKYENRRQNKEVISGRVSASETYPETPQSTAQHSTADIYNTADQKNLSTELSTPPKNPTIFFSNTPETARKILEDRGILKPKITG